MKTPADISPRQHTANLRAKADGEMECLQHVYFQYRFYYKNKPSFNGKEKDYESGYHYYGARYYWSELLTGWLSVDPMMDKYPSMSPYNYCAWNPVILIDPDGNAWEPTIQQERTFDKCSAIVKPDMSSR